MRSRHCRKLAPAMSLLVLWLAADNSPIPTAHAAEETSPYLGPCALAAAKDGQTLYVACADAQQVAWIDLASGTVSRRVPVPAEPTDLVVTPDGRQLIVACAAPRSTIAVLDAVSGQLLTKLPAGHTAMGPAISPDGTRLYVCNRFQDDVSIIDLKAGKELARVAAVREPIAAAVTPDGRAVWVANHLPKTRTDGAFTGTVAPFLTIIDAQTHATTTIELLSGSNSVRGLCLSPDGTRAFVTHLLSNFQMVPFRVDMGWINTNVVSIFDTRQRTLISTIGLDEFYLGAGNPWGVACSADGKSVYVSGSGTHELDAIDTAILLSDVARRTMSPMMGVWPIYPSLGESLWQRTKLPGQGPRGLTSVGSKVYIAEYFSDTVAVVDRQTAGGGSVGTIALGPTPKLTLQRRGQLLFHDATLCYQTWQSCASCHPDGRVDGQNWDLMNDGVGNPKNTKSMLLSHQTPPAMSEGVRETAEDAVRSGLTHILFAARPEADAAAIDAYLKSLQPVPSPHLIDGRLSPAAVRGQQLFASERVACHKCHPAPLYTDLKRHHVGSRGLTDYTDRFDTPTLVEVWRTAPYLHDGRYTTVKDLLVEGQHGLKGGHGNPPTEPEISDLVQFVLSL